ncbi:MULTISPECIES: hypothetical protein [Streptomyces]|uniref:hypothetical protein n=1 Tax=Streptomyces TaxID=1883 RepID=UPI00167629F5|nr:MULTISPECIES: hypothetical protein [Streptomyces]MBD3575926.1 hypothetical protein [Streptomyces sp. KD18]GGS81742.1 hypothetical protein GCM10010286_02890 [Streptomyces toxytricini]
MIALIRYTFATMLHTQRYVAPLLLFMGLMGVLTANGNGPLPAAYASSAGAMFVCSTWLAMAVVSLDEPPQRAITVVTAGGRPLRVLLAAIGTVLLSCLALMVVGLAFPLWLGDHAVTAADLLLGIEAQLACALTGTAIGVLCSRQVFTRQGHAVVAALALLMVALFTKGLPPVNGLFTLMATTSDAAPLLAPAGAMSALSALLLTAATAATHFTGRRRQ